MWFWTYLERRVPWAPEDGLRALAISGVCAAALAIVWVGASGEAIFNKDTGWLTAGVAILLVQLYGLASFVTRGRRAIGLRRSRLLPDALAGEVILSSSSAWLSSSSEGGSSDARNGGVVVVPGIDLFHMDGCPMTAGRATVRQAPAKAQGSGLRPCNICHIDEPR